MCGYNDRRSKEERRKGERRWLGMFSGAREHKAPEYNEMKNHDRRENPGRRDPESIYNRICC